ncbi:hypothetical protein GPECTOR_2g1177 [Gonium pectorale]|uniref:Uncharacterized protein n=1 Tax=Gonium pectorale TaxID=33097 RepID=A0A150H0D2_GONPE|nr:hypothetical protein GPECTOR_2g1177 [Gonium pectorale]|eukprot:KXZ55627.1 hypothetical protein GPECTOR_2g1177 [Gonium pectorale]
MQALANPPSPSTGRRLPPIAGGSGAPAASKRRSSTGGVNAAGGAGAAQSAPQDRTERAERAAARMAAAQAQAPVATPPSQRLVATPQSMVADPRVFDGKDIHDLVRVSQEDYNDVARLQRVITMGLGGKTTEAAKAEAMLQIREASVQNPLFSLTPAMLELVRDSLQSRNRLLRPAAAYALAGYAANSRAGRGLMACNAAELLPRLNAMLRCRVDSMDARYASLAILTASMHSENKEAVGRSGAIPLLINIIRQNLGRHHAGFGYGESALEHVLRVGKRGAPHRRPPGSGGTGAAGKLHTGDDADAQGDGDGEGEASAQPTQSGDVTAEPTESGEADADHHEPAVGYAAQPAHAHDRKSGSGLPPPGHPAAARGRESTTGNGPAHDRKSVGGPALSPHDRKSGSGLASHSPAHAGGVRGRESVGGALSHSHSPSPAAAWPPAIPASDSTQPSTVSGESVQGGGDAGGGGAVAAAAAAIWRRPWTGELGHVTTAGSGVSGGGQQGANELGTYVLAVKPAGAHAAAALVNLAELPANRQRMREAGIAALLEDVLSSRNENSIKERCRLLVDFLQMDTPRFKMAKAASDAATIAYTAHAAVAFARHHRAGAAGGANLAGGALSGDALNGTLTWKLARQLEMGDDGAAGGGGGAGGVGKQGGGKEGAVLHGQQSVARAVSRAMTQARRISTAPQESAAAGNAIGAAA